MLVGCGELLWKQHPRMQVLVTALCALPLEAEPSHLSEIESRSSRYRRGLLPSSAALELAPAPGASYPAQGRR